MKSRTLTCITAIALFAVLAIPVRLVAQDDRDHQHKHHHYKLIDMGTFGGPESYILPTPAIGSHNQVNKRGSTVGGAGTPIPTTTNNNPAICGGFEGMVPFVNHAFEYQNGVVADLGTLAGADKCSVATAINGNGEIVGQSENNVIDPVLGFDEIRAVRWDDGKILDLGTLGGTASAGISINERAQVVGFALNATPDPLSIYDFQLFSSANGTQTRAFLWDRDNGMQDLGTLGTGTDAWANFVNDRGQVAGFSYTNSTPNPVTGLPTTHPFLWEEGIGMTDLGSLGGTLAGSELPGYQGALNNRGQVTGASTLRGDLVFHPFLWTKPGPMQDLGTLGGECGSAAAINDAGEVVGAADVPGPCSQTIHAFLWKSNVMTDLGTVEGDPCSYAAAINSNGQIVGESFACDFSVEHAVLWRNGQIMDLNKLVPSNSTLHLTRAFAINDRGEIAGIGALAGCTNDRLCGHAFLLVPCDEHHDDSECEDEGEGPAVGRGDTNQRANVVLPENVRKMLRERMTGWYPYRGFGVSPRD
jgi:probable HAF family extracellular repeat protein